MLHVSSQNVTLIDVSEAIETILIMGMLSFLDSLGYNYS